jgi:hypothetical protein
VSFQGISEARQKGQGEIRSSDYVANYPKEKGPKGAKQ